MKPKMLSVGTEAAVHRGSIKKMFFKNFAKFTGKQIYRIFFFDKVAGLQAATLSKKRLPCKCFPVNFDKFLRTPFLLNTSRRLFLSTPRILLKPHKEAVRTWSSNLQISCEITWKYNKLLERNQWKSFFYVKLQAYSLQFY